MSDEGWFPERFGPIYERPPGAPCPDCECCTRRLCQLAAGNDIPCSQQSDDPQAVAGCPCASTAAARARTRTMREDEDDDEGGTDDYRGWLP
jgi:hypothetical protein